MYAKICPHPAAGTLEIEVEVEVGGFDSKESLGVPVC